jgi:hypothetical protein
MLEQSRDSLKKKRASWVGGQSRESDLVRVVVVAVEVKVRINIIFVELDSLAMGSWPSPASPSSMEGACCPKLGNQCKWTTLLIDKHMQGKVNAMALDVQKIHVAHTSQANSYMQ